MKVLIISAYFPPYNAIGSVRLGKLAAFLEENGCDVRVIAAIDQSLPATLPMELHESRVQHVSWFDLHSVPRRLLSFMGNTAKKGGNQNSNFIGGFYDLFRSLFHWPDRHMFWYFPALRASRKVLKSWRPDIIYASGWPLTSLKVASTLSKESSIPWVAELRDLWVDNPYAQMPFWRKWFDRRDERKHLSSSSLLVTVSEPLAEILARKYAIRTEVVLNGFDRSDAKFPVIREKSKKLTIAYTGMIYPNKRDPTPLFKALKELGPLARQVQVQFYGRMLPGLTRLINDYSVNELVKINPPLSHHEALQLQANADILLLLLWDSEHERGVYTGKLFEYLGAQRPILSIGLENGVAAQLIKERKAGFVSNSPQKISLALRKWLDEKKRYGHVEPIEESSLSGLSRQEQFSVLLPALKDILKKHRSKRKIIYVTSGLNIGGAERHLTKIIPLMSENFDVSIFTLRRGQKLEQKLTEAGIKVHGPLFNLGRIASRSLSAIQLMYIFLQNRDAILHFFLPEAYIVGGICGALSMHPRMVMSRRSLNHYQAKYVFATSIELMLHKYMIAILGNSRTVIDNLSEEGVSEEKLKLIYNGIEPFDLDLDVERPKKRKSLGIEENEVVIICVANFITYKGHFDLLDAISSISNQLKGKWRLVCVGRDDGIKSSLQSRVSSLGLEKKVFFLAETIDIEKIWCIADIGVLASHQEGFSNSILEGMSAGLPMVVTNVGGNSEAVEDSTSGFVVPPHSPQQLGIRLLQLVNDVGLRKRFGEVAKYRAEKYFSLKHCVREYERLYDSLFETNQKS